MNKILLFLLGGCIIGSAITIFSAQNKQKKIPTQQNAESKQNTQQEDRNIRNMGCLILVIIFLFSIILSEYDIPEEDLPIIGIITIIVFGIMICYNFFKKKKQNQ